MDREKEIEELCKIIADYSFCGDQCTFDCEKRGCAARKFATHLIDKGYGNVEQAVKKLQQQIHKKFSTRLAEFQNKENDYIELEDYDEASKCAIVYHEIENVLNGFDELVTKLYGKGEA